MTGAAISSDCYFHAPDDVQLVDDQPADQAFVEGHAGTGVAAMMIHTAQAAINSVTATASQTTGMAICTSSTGSLSRMMIFLFEGSSVESLLTCCCPPTIAGFVIAVVVDAIYGMARRRSSSHVFDKILIAIQPPAADRDTARSISVVIYVFGAVATLLHAPPD